VPVADLIATQDVVHENSLRHQLTTGGEGTPLIVKSGGKYYVDDGTHRAAAAKLKGEKSVRAKVLDLDAVPAGGAAR
jgi:hypothetical protein